MRTSRVVKPEHTPRGVELDMRISDKRGEELCEEIVASVERSQLFLETELPSRLVVTQNQFVTLIDHTEEMHQTTDRMFMTPLNVMEVVIDREYDTIPEVEQSMLETDELEQEIRDHDPHQYEHQQPERPMGDDQDRV